MVGESNSIDSDTDAELVRPDILAAVEVFDVFSSFLLEIERNSLVLVGAIVTAVTFPAVFIGLFASKNDPVKDPCVNRKFNKFKIFEAKGHLMFRIYP